MWTNGAAVQTGNSIEIMLIRKEFSDVHQYKSMIVAVFSK